MSYYSPDRYLTSVYKVTEADKGEQKEKAVNTFTYPENRGVLKMIWVNFCHLNETIRFEPPGKLKI